MRLATPIAAMAALFAAMPASATSSLRCTAQGQRGFLMFVSVGTGGGVDFVRLEGRGGFERGSPRLAAGAIDARRLSFRVSTARGGALLARLDTRAARRAYVGTFQHGGRVRQVSCRYEPGE